MITLEEARRLMMGAVSRAGSEMIRIGDALGRVVASDITAPANLPAEPRSRLDGYALRSAETEGASDVQPVRVRLNPKTVSAGHVPTTQLEAGTCTRVMTGAVLPAGADAVLAQEQARIEGDHLIVNRPVKPASGLVEEGSDALRGEVLAADGEVLTPTRLALVAAFGMERVPVTIRPRVALLSTGDEVREPGSPPTQGISFSNNRHLLAWLTQIHGGAPIHLGVSGDDPAQIVGCLNRAEADLFVTTGGTGRGDRDFVQEVWRRLGVRKVFERILISPGRGTLGGLRGGCPFLALPGNPWGGAGHLRGAHQTTLVAPSGLLLPLAPDDPGHAEGTGHQSGRFLPCSARRAHTAGNDGNVFTVGEKGCQHLRTGSKPLWLYDSGAAYARTVSRR